MIQIVINNSPSEDRIPTIAEVWGWQGGTAQTKRENFSDMAISPWLPYHASYERFIIFALHHISH